MRGVANRVGQATTNFLETFPFFAALVFVARVTGHHSLLTILGAHFYFWGRLGYLLAAAAGFSLVRSMESNLISFRTVDRVQPMRWDMRSL